MTAAPAAPERSTYLLVDGENIDATLGASILNTRPTSDQRPRWERVRTFAQQSWGQPVKALFFLNASSGQLPLPFVQALLALHYQPIPLAGGPGVKVVDVGIQRMLAALEDRPGDVMLASHDGDFLPEIDRLLGADRRVAVLGFREFVNSGFAELSARGLTTYDLEDDVQAFTVVLPRVRIIPIDAFDPTRYL